MNECENRVNDLFMFCTVKDPVLNFEGGKGGSAKQRQT